MDAGRSPRMALGTARLSALVGAVVLLVTGCAEGSELPGDAPVATYSWDDSAGMQALLEGTLALEDGCVYVLGDDGTRTLPVFPQDRVGWDSADEVLTYDGAEFAMGAPIAAGGGWDTPPDDASIPASCEPDEWGDVMLVQDDSLTPPGSGRELRAETQTSRAASVAWPSTREPS